MPSVHGMQAQTADAKADCTDQAVSRIRSTLEWTKARDFMMPTQMHKWDHLVCTHYPLDQLKQPACHGPRAPLSPCCFSFPFFRSGSAQFSMAWSCVSAKFYQLRWYRHLKLLPHWRSCDHKHFLSSSSHCLQLLSCCRRRYHVNHVSAGSTLAMRGLRSWLLEWDLCLQRCLQSNAGSVAREGCRGAARTGGQGSSSLPRVLQYSG